MFNFILVNLLNGLMAISLLLIGYTLFDILTPKWDFKDVFEKGYISNGGLVIGAFLIGLSIIIACTAG
jgi:uncharacterized membrane protein YjfL (UPF0719 family)